MRVTAALALLGLVLLASLASRCDSCRLPLESHLAAKAKERLGAEGLGHVDVSLNHLDASLVGTVASQADRDRALKIVSGIEGLRANTDLNRLAIAAAPPPVPSSLRLELGPVANVLSGTVPNEALKSEIGNSVEAGLAERNGGTRLALRNNLTVQANALSPSWASSVPRAANVYARNVAAGSFALGEEITLTGEVASQAAKDEIAGSARGLVGVPSKVLDRLTVAAAPVAAEPPIPPPAVPPARSSVFDFGLSGENVTLKGLVSSEAPKKAVRDAVLAKLPIATIDDSQLLVDGQMAKPAWEDGLAGATGAFMSAAKSGSFQLSDKGAELRGDPSSEQVKQSTMDAFARLVGSPSKVSVSEWKVYQSATALPPADTQAMQSLFAQQAIYFDSGSSKLSPAETGKAIAIAEAIKKSGPGAQFLVGGWADSTGKPEANQRLSMQRALAVKSKLVELGLPAKNLIVEYNGSDPKAKGNDRRGRRVEIRLR